MPDSLQLDTDVLVIGGGPAALWSALSAREAGARVLLVDKGFAGASGVAAAASVGHWCVPPDPAAREQAMRLRHAQGAELPERSWMARVLELTWERWPEIGDTIGYPVEEPQPGMAPVTAVQGPVYLRAMRRRASHAGVRILDHAPALELLVDDTGAVGGAAGVQRQKGRAWRIEAGAVVLATGGCSWRSGSLGSNVDTGDGYLMGVEVGAQLSGLEFSNYYGTVPVGTTIDKNGFNMMATFTNADGDVVSEGWNGGLGAIGPAHASIVGAGLEGPVYAVLDRLADEPSHVRAAARAMMPNYFMVFDRLGIDPFRQRFEIEFIQEGTVRGTGGLALADDSCWTGVPGLWTAGDTATREYVAGGGSGAGAANAAWTISSGTWSGEAAARHAEKLRAGRDRAAARRLRPAGRVGLRPSGAASADWRELSVATQAQMLPIVKNGIRSEPVMAGAAQSLEDLWRKASSGLGGLADAREAVRARETAAMIATGRWAFLSARTRTETRGMHVRSDFSALDTGQRDRVLSGGLDALWSRRVPIEAFDTNAAVA